MKKMGLRKSEASLRSEVLAYAARHYGTAPEYLWRALPGYAALRHQDNRKWYGIVMNVTTDKLGPPGREPVDILEVKCDPILSGSFCLNPGVLPAYHMKQGNWITVLLDGTVDPETVFALLDMSYRLTGPRAAHTPAQGRQTWIFPANPRRFDLAQAFAQDPEILWHQRNHIAAGDTVYIYMTAPIASILYRCEVLEANLPCPWDDPRGPEARAFRMKLRETYAPGTLPIQLLQAHGMRSVRSPRRACAALVRALEEAAAHAAEP